MVTSRTSEAMEIVTRYALAPRTLTVSVQDSVSLRGTGIRISTVRPPSTPRED